jgi:short-subunit dehydrogenase
MTGVAGSTISTNDYNANKVLYDYLEINNTTSIIPTLSDRVTFSGVKVIIPPAELEIADPLDTIKVYINGVKYSSGYYTPSYTSNSITYIFNTGSLGFSLDGDDSVYIAGKFQLL